jgi:PAS domain S-box-containing protein
MKLDLDPGLNEFVIVTDKDSVIQWVNHRFAQRLGLKMSEIIGQQVSSLIASGDSSETVVWIADQIDHHKTFKLTVSYPNGPKPEQQIEFDVFPIDDADGFLANYMAVGIRKKNNSPIPVPTFAEGEDSASHLSFARGREMFLELERLNKEEQLYLDPKLSLQKVSQLLHTNKQYVSQLISFFSGLGYSSYINDYRLERYQHLVKQRGEVVHWKEVGFGSYSAFRRSVKRRHKLSPSELNRALLQELKLQNQSR